MVRGDLIRARSFELMNSSEHFNHRYHDCLCVHSGLGTTTHLRRMGVGSFPCFFSFLADINSMWMVDAALSLVSAIYMPFQLIIQPAEIQLRTVTALQLFPVVTTVVCAASGSIVAEVLPNPQQALATVITAYVIWGIGVPTALMIMVIYFHRLVVHKLPPREVIVSTFLPLGPLNMGAFALMQLGKVAMSIFPRTDTIHPLAGMILYNMGVICGLIMWSFALLWLFFAVASICQSKQLPFNLGWWG